MWFGGFVSFSYSAAQTGLKLTILLSPSRLLGLQVYTNLLLFLVCCGNCFLFFFFWIWGFFFKKAIWNHFSCIPYLWTRVIFHVLNIKEQLHTVLLGNRLKGLKSMPRNTTVCCVPFQFLQVCITLQPKREAKVHRSGAAQSPLEINRIPCALMLDMGPQDPVFAQWVWLLLGSIISLSVPTPPFWNGNIYAIYVGSMDTVFLFFFIFTRAQRCFWVLVGSMVLDYWILKWLGLWNLMERDQVHLELEKNMSLLRNRWSVVLKGMWLRIGWHGDFWPLVSIVNLITSRNARVIISKELFWVRVHEGFSETIPLGPLWSNQ